LRRCADQGEYISDQQLDSANIAHIGGGEQRFVMGAAILEARRK
jgi:hypothetical protein